MLQLHLHNIKHTLLFDFFHTNKQETDMILLINVTLYLNQNAASRKKGERYSFYFFSWFPFHCHACSTAKHEDGDKITGTYCTKQIITKVKCKAHEKSHITLYHNNHVLCCARCKSKAPNECFLLLLPSSSIPCTMTQQNQPLIIQYYLLYVI